MIAPEKATVSKRQHFVWKAPDREWLEYQHFMLGKSARQIAASVGCSEWKTQQWIREAGWRKPVAVTDDPDGPMKIGTGGGARFVGVKREWLVRQYVELDKSAKQIADDIDTTHPTVWKWLLKFEIPTRTRDEMNARHAKRMSGSNNPSYVNGTSMNYHKRLALKHYEHQCEWCGTEDDLQVHHRDHDRRNGNIDNLSLFCGVCNRLESHVWILKQRGLAETEWLHGHLLIKFRR